MSIRTILVFAIIVLVSLCSDSLADTVSLTPESDWFSVLSGNALRPGDEVVLSAGVYSDARRLALQHRGTAAEPILIRAADDAKVVFQRPNANQNSFNLEGCQHLVIRGIEITGGSAAIRIGPDRDANQSSDVVLEDLHIHNIGGVAVTCNFEGGEFRRMVFRRNHIHHTKGHGEAFYLGANEGKAIISDSVIENNYIHHLNGPNVSQGDGIEIKLGSFGNRIVGNVIHDTKYPGIIVYGTGGRERNLIEGNLIWNTGDHGIQAAADAIIRGNWIVQARGCGIYSREHQGAIPSRLHIEGNRIFAKNNAAIRIIGGGQANKKGNAFIELVANRLFAGQLALRIDNGIKLKAVDNRGVGRVQGSRTFLATWRKLAPTQAPIPEKANHPAWRFLDRSTVANLFAL